MIEYPCPRCNSPMSSPDSLAGGTEACPHCGYQVKVPAGRTDDLPEGPEPFGQARAVTDREQLLWSGQPANRAYWPYHALAAFLGLLGMFLLVVAILVGSGVTAGFGMAPILVGLAGSIGCLLDRRYTRYEVTSRMASLRWGILSRHRATCLWVCCARWRFGRDSRIAGSVWVPSVYGPPQLRTRHWSSGAWPSPTRSIGCFWSLALRPRKAWHVPMPLRRENPPLTTGGPKAARRTTCAPGGPSSAWWHRGRNPLPQKRGKNTRAPSIRNPPRRAPVCPQSAIRNPQQAMR